MRFNSTIGAVALLTATTFGDTSSALAAPLERAWYSPAELLPVLAKRHTVRWAIPPSLSARAMLGGDVKLAEALDTACKQWDLSWMESGGVIVVHREDNTALKHWSAALASGKSEATTAAWELSLLQDARAVTPLAEALSSPNPAVALAAASGLNRLVREIPLGRTQRVQPPQPGQTSLAAAFPLPKGTMALLDSPYPPVRAAALRLLLAHGGKPADMAKAKTQSDASELVRQVHGEFFYQPAKTSWRGPRKKPTEIPPLAADPDAVEQACAKMIGEIPALAKGSSWKQMRDRVRIMRAWSRAGSAPAKKALFELTTSDVQKFWFPAFVLKELALTGGKDVAAKLKEFMPSMHCDTLVRGLEESYSGEALMEFARPQVERQTVCYVTARMAPRQAVDDLLQLAARKHYAAIDAIGVVGHPQAEAVLKKLLHTEEPNSATLSFRAAKALGNLGTQDAANVLLDAAGSKSRLRRHGAVLFLGRTGGPEVAQRLREILLGDDDRLVRAAAADALAQISGQENLTAVAKFRQQDAALPVAKYQPRNPRFGKDFPVGEWVNLKIRIKAFANYGEMGWNYDAANRLFFRYGGCSGYTNELTLFDLGTEQFVQRRPNEEMAGWGDRRPPRGCSAGRTWDPYQKVAWLGPAIGGSVADLAISEYYNRDGGYRFCSYDLASDRFRPGLLREAPYGAPPKRFAYDWKHGLLYPVKFQPLSHVTKDWWILDTRKSDAWSAAAWLPRTNPKGPYPRFIGYSTAAVDQDSGLLVVYVPPLGKTPPETWTYDPRKNIWENMTPDRQPRSKHGAGFAYDPFHKVLVLQGGKKVTQFGGPEDSITWAYDVRTNTWTNLAGKNGPGNAWVGAMDFDPEHNVFVLFNARDRNVWAYRYKSVDRGTKVAPVVPKQQLPK